MANSCDLFHCIVNKVASKVQKLLKYGKLSLPDHSCTFCINICFGSTTNSHFSKIFI